MPPTQGPGTLTSLNPTQNPLHHVPSDHLARVVLATFLFLFMASRIVVFLTMAGKLPPQLFLHVSGTHVHHLNYGITILSVVGALLLFVQPTGERLTWVAAAYGIGLALTFDEFGMWLHLGGPYWQRESFDAVVVVAGLLALIAYRPELAHIRPHHWWTFAALLVLAVVFGFLMIRSFDLVGTRFGPLLEQLERGGQS
jgi:hypothetical protein